MRGGGTYLIDGFFAQGELHRFIFFFADNHIKSWDPTTASPGSPKHYPPIREVKMHQFPHLNLPQPGFSSSSNVSTSFSKVSDNITKFKLPELVYF